MRIKKKKLYMILISLILLILVVFIFLFQSGLLGNSFVKINRYDSLMETCDIERKFFRMNIKCDVFVNETSQKDGKNCLDLTVVNKENTNILPLEVCEKEKVLDISDPVLDTDMKVPMHMVFEYTYFPPLFYCISDISMELMEDNTAIDILLKLKEKEINIKDVRVQENIEMKEKGYYLNESSSIGMITFVETKIDEIVAEGEELIMKLTLTIDNGQREYIFKMKKFMYAPDSDLTKKIEINKSNISVIDIEKSYNINFMYIPKDSILTMELLDISCNTEGNIFLVLCDKRDEFNTLKLDAPIEDYLSDKYLSKLTVNYLY